MCSTEYGSISNSKRKTYPLGEYKFDGVFQTLNKTIQDFCWSTKRQLCCSPKENINIEMPVQKWEIIFHMASPTLI